MRRIENVKLPPNFGKINGEDHPDTTLYNVAYKCGWNDAIELAAEVAAHLNGWGSPTAPELADHIARIIRSNLRPANSIAK